MFSQGVVDDAICWVYNDRMFDFMSMVIILLIVFVSIILHEIAHGYASYLLGDDTAKISGRLTLNPISHIDPFMTILLPILLAASGMPVLAGAKPVPIDSSKFHYKFNEWGMAIVAIAGPLANLLIAFVCFGLLVFTSSSVDSSAYPTILYTIVSINLNLFVFNMIPIPPLDGSRIMHALAPDFIRDFMEYIEQFGIIFILVLMMVGGSQFGLFIDFVTKAILVAFSGIFGL